MPDQPTAAREWHVWGPRGYQWIKAKDGDAACEAYRARYQLPMHTLDQLSVDDVRRADV